jgi:hypothetical protein
MGVKPIPEMQDEPGNPLGGTELGQRCRSGCEFISLGDASRHPGVIIPRLPQDAGFDFGPNELAVANVGQGLEGKTGTFGEFAVYNVSGSQKV